MKKILMGMEFRIKIPRKKKMTPAKRVEMTILQARQAGRRALKLRNLKRTILMRFTPEDPTRNKEKNLSFLGYRASDFDRGREWPDSGIHKR